MAEQAQEQAMIQEFNAFMRRLANADDSLCALWVAARIEKCLTAGIRRKFQSIPDNDWNAVFGRGMSLYRLIVTARDLGLIDKKEAAALHALRCIRNDAAHGDESIRFSAQVHLARINTCVESWLSPGFTLPPGNVDGPRTLFITAAAMMIAKLQYRVQDMT